MPAAAKPFTPTPFLPRPRLRGPHLQTIAGNFMRRVNLLPPGKLRRFRVADNSEVLCSCHWQPDRASAITLIIVHGLEGSMDSNYVIGTGSKAWTRGMNVVRMNMRNCGGSDALTPTLYHSGLSADVAAVTNALIGQDQLRSIALAGFSMGGNLVLKCAGEFDGHAPAEIKAVVAVSPAMDLGPSAAALHHPRNRIYEMKFMRGLRRRYARKRALFPDLYGDIRLSRFASIWDFDELITARYNGFTGAEDYYHRASAARVISQIQIPTLIIHALDDPFIRVTAETRRLVRANPFITYLETKHGGHCAFLALPSPGYDGRWAEMTAVDFVEQSALSSQR